MRGTDLRQTVVCMQQYYAGSTCLDLALVFSSVGSAREHETSGSYTSQMACVLLRYLRNCSCLPCKCESACFWEFLTFFGFGVRRGADMWVCGCVFKVHNDTLLKIRRGRQIFLEQQHKTHKSIVYRNTEGLFFLFPVEYSIAHSDVYYSLQTSVCMQRKARWWLFVTSTCEVL